jgi:outer membrane protein assembly factor BamB
MFSIGRIPVLRYQLLTWCATCLLLVCVPLLCARFADAQTAQPKTEPKPVTGPKSPAAPRSIAVPLATTRAAARAINTRWIAPPGHVTDRQLVMRLTRFQEAAQGPWPENFNWNDVLEKAHAGILAAAEDTLVIAVPINYSEGAPLVRFGATPPSLRSLKDVAEEIIADLPPAGRDAWLRLISDRANAEFNEAVRSGDGVTINRIASQDVHTPAGYSAIDLLGNRHLDQNRPLAALRQFYRLLISEIARESREPYLSIRTSAAWTSLGRHNQARLALIELSQWLIKHPKTKAELSEDFLREAVVWQQSNVTSTVAAFDTGSGNRFSAAGLLPLASESAFSPDARVLWKSLTSGFNVPITEEDRKKFSTRFGDEDVNAEDPFPESEAETAALVEVGLAHLARRDQRRKTNALPACEPVVARGQAVFRTLNRIRSVDLATGTLRWESFLTDSAFSEQFDLRQAMRSVNVPKESHDISNPLNQRQTAVVYSRSRHDRTAGTLSTDGNQLFSLEEGGVTAKATSYRQPGLRQAAPRSWNRLCAFDLESGILQWQIGGPEGEHELPAAGMFFLGVPTVIDDSIYVLGEQSNWVRLLCLDPSTGKIEWVQPVTTATAAITREGLRRIGGISPCSAEGLIICPTIAGQVVAFDPEQKRLAWTSAYRTMVTVRSISRGMFRTPTPINAINVDSPDRWRRDSMFVRAGRIVMSPLDSQQLICLDGVSGDTLWSQPRGRGMFIAAEFDSQIIVVDDSAVRAVSLTDGTLSWTVRLNQRMPTGRGLRIGPLLHLPVATVLADDSSADDLFGGDAPEPVKNGRLVTIDLKVGRLLAESKTPDGYPLGNLVAHQGQLITQRFDSVIALESLPTIEANLARQLDQKPGDSSALESRARIRLHEGRLQEGLSDLQAAVQDKSAKTALNLLVEQALEQLRHGQELVDTTQQVLATADLTAVQRNSLDAIKVERLLAAGDFGAAFDLLLKSPQTDAATGASFIVHVDPLSISSSAWVSSRLQATYEQTSARRPGLAHVEALDQKIRERLDEAIADSDVTSLREWLQLFSWHKLFAEAAVAFTERLDAEDDALEIESLLTSLSLHSDSVVAASARDRLPKQSASIAWPDTAPRVATASHNLSVARRVLVDVSGSRSPTIRGWEFELTLDGLTALSPSGKPLWTLSDEQLGSDPPLTTNRHGSSRIFSSGHLMAVSTGTEFSVFDIRDATPRRLWMKSFISREAEGFLQMRQMHRLGSMILFSGNKPVGSVDFLNSHSLVYRTGSTLRVVSVTSGETIWTRDQIPHDALVFGDEFAVSVVHVASAHCQQFDIRTGTLINEHFDIPLVGVLTTYGSDLIIRQTRGTTHAISRVDLHSGKPTWQHDFPSKGSIRPTAEDRLVEFHPGGKILVREQSSGEVIINVQAEKQLTPGRFFLHETPTEYVLLSANPQRTFQSRIGPLNLQGSRQEKIEGPAYGIDRRTGKLLWSVNIEPQYFAAKQPSQLPFVVLACWSSLEGSNRQLTRSGRTYPMRILDTRTGNTIFATDGKENDEVVLNYLSVGDAKEKQASITFAKTVLHFDYSGKPQEPAPSQD